MPFANNQGTRIYFEIVGTGFPVMFHTGAGGDSRMWKEAGYLAGMTGFQLILLDHRGHGRSDKPKDPAAHHLDHYVTDVVAVLETMHLPTIAFWGYSDGRCVGYELAYRYPERVAALLATGGMEAADPPVYQAERRQRAKDAARIREGGIAELIDDLEQVEQLTLPPWLRQNFLGTDSEMIALELEGWCGWDGPWPLLPHIVAPTLLLLGEHEDDGNAGRATKVMPNAQSVVFPGLGHIGAFLHNDLALPHALTLLGNCLGAS